MAVNGTALASVLAGSIFLYAGIKGKSVSQAVQYVIQGKSPAQAPAADTITAAYDLTSSTSSGGESTSTGAPANLTGVAAAAMTGQGHCYKFGGAPGKDGSGCWDCSSFANWVLGHLTRNPIPGYAAGAYDGSVHGPATVEWLSWSGAQTISANQAQPGDVIVWASHMGIYLGGGSMISALNPNLGTRVTSVSGGAPGGEGSGTYRRVK